MNSKTLVFLSLVLAIALSIDCNVTTDMKVDCGYMGITQQQCQAKGCCWVPVQSSKKAFLENNLQDTPWCFYPKDSNICQKYNFDSSTPGFDDNWYSHMYNNFVANLNIQGKGGVVAAPDTQTPGGSYYYHWMRDSALSMKAYMDINNYDLATIQTNMQQYAQFVLHIQSEPDTHGIDVRTEPKFDLPDGQIYEGGWCRPQTDGPGLESITFIAYANKLLDAGQSSYVSQYLWTSGAYNGGIIKYDLDWAAGAWQQSGCDLWEEIQSNDFFWNRASFARALQIGSVFAQRMGDSQRAQTYLSASQAINATIPNHWNGQYLYESQNRQKDSSVIHAILSFYPYAYSHSYVAATINVYNQLFCTAYTINQNDDANNIPGILYGRYQGDSYAGGNPWQLLTAALGELFYNLAAQMASRNNEVLTEAEAGPWRSILKLSEHPTANEFAIKALRSGDAVLYRIYYHVQGDGYMITEQIDRNTGKQLSAKNLTWSYANILHALYVRKNFQLDKLQPLAQPIIE